MTDKNANGSEAAFRSALMSPDEIGRETGLGHTTVWNLIGSGAFDVRKIGRLTKITRQSFDAWLAALPRISKNEAA